MIWHPVSRRVVGVLIASFAIAGIAAPGAAQMVPCLAGTAAGFPCSNVDLMAYVPTNALVAACNLGEPSSAADIWGWTDTVSGREFSVQAHSAATSFVEITDPENPVYIGCLPAPLFNLLWRDVKVMNDHAYVVGDGDIAQPGTDGLQIFDLTQLLTADPIPPGGHVFSETALYDGFADSHNFVVNPDTNFGYAVANNTCGGEFHMLDMTIPAAPVFVGCMNSGLPGSVHDAQCVIYHGDDVDYQGQEICVSSNEDLLYIADVTNKAAPFVIASQTIAGSSYVHQGWFTEDHNYFVSNDELDEVNNPGTNTRAYMWDMRDLDNPVQFATYFGPTVAIDHNNYFVGPYLHQTNYTAGYRVLDATNIAAGTMVEIAHFDTHPSDDVTNFAGSWSNYPFFPSGNVIISNIEDGLYIVRPNLPQVVCGSVGLFDDDFETATADPSFAWDQMRNPDGSLGVATAPRALEGDQSLSVDLVTGPKGLRQHWLLDDLSAPVDDYCFSFLFNPENSTIPTGRVIKIWGARSDIQRRLAHLDLQFDGTGYRVRGRVHVDGGGQVSTGFSDYLLADGSNLIEGHWLRSSGADDGLFEIKVNGVVVATLTGLDNDQRSLSQVGIGYLGLARPGTSGSIVFDLYEAGTN